MNSSNPVPVRIITGVLFAVMVTVMIISIGCDKTGNSAAESGKAARFHCPMHPTYVSDRQGDCPICGMRLVPIKSEGSADGLVAKGASAVPGRTAIMVSPEKRQKIGLVTSVVEEKEMSTVVRTTAVVAHDETRLARIAPRFGGWVTKLHVNYVGQQVEKGQPLFTVYSPELFTAENEYLLAVRNRQMLTNSPAAERESANALVESARRRLELLQISDEELRALESSGKAGDELLMRSPVSGHVVAKGAVEGKSFMAGETLYEIADLDQLWLRAAVFEYELPQIQVGEAAKVTLPHLNATMESKVTFISPHIDPQTRRGEVRLEIENPGHRIRPDMWANVEILADQSHGLAVPASAIIDTGIRQIVFVDREDGHLAPVEIQTGARTDDFVEVKSGLKAGDKVVSRALFLIDSESQLRAATEAMTSGEHSH